MNSAVSRGEYFLLHYYFGEAVCFVRLNECLFSSDLFDDFPETKVYFFCFLMEDVVFEGFVFLWGNDRFNKFVFGGFVGPFDSFLNCGLWSFFVECVSFFPCYLFFLFEHFGFCDVYVFS